MSKPSSTADKILDCARGLILAGGYNGFSYADIAEVVGIRKASIHHHFPSKVDLVCALVVNYRESAKAGFVALERAAPDPREQLGLYLAYWEKCLVDASDPFCLCALLAGELPALPPPVAREVRLHFDTLSAWLTSALERGANAGVFQLASTPRAEAEAFMASVHGGMLSARAYSDATVFGTITRSLLARLSV